MCRRCRKSTWCLPFILCGTTAFLLGCNAGEMRDQPRYDPLEANEFFRDGLASRPLVKGTVARGQLRTDDLFFAGRIDGKLATTFPQPPVTKRLKRGRERYDIFCAACHDRVGTGGGMVVRRGYPRPPSFHTERLRAQPVGHIYDVITNGYGRMPDYRDQIPPADRWAIVAYVRALQLSQHTAREALRAQDLQKLEAAEKTGENENPRGS